MTAQTYQDYQSYLHQHTSELCEWDMQVSNANTLLVRQQKNDLRQQMQVNAFDSGVVLSRMMGHGQGGYTSTVQDFEHNFSLFVMLAGSNHFVVDKQTVSVDSGQLWLVKGYWQSVQENIQTTNGQLQALHLDFSHERLRRWQDDGILSKGVFKPIKGSDIIQLSNNITPIKHLAQKIVHHPYYINSKTNDDINNHLNSINFLELESMSLDLTAKLLRFCMDDKQTQRQRSQIDEAIDIIYAEFDKPLTISTLAHRIGMNECYFKKHFKARTGKTVAQFIRQLRLQSALEMLTQQNKTVKETMYFVGYQHAGHFNDIFLRHFGFLPSDIKK